MFKRDLPSGLQQLETLLTNSPVEASLFLPFTIFRLRPYVVDRQVTLHVTLYEVNSPPIQTHQLRLTWDSASDTLVTPPVQAHVITEWAACGIALAMVPLYTTHRVIEVAQIGDRFDYWLGDRVREVGLEVSGTVYGDLFARAQIKQNQSRSNPYKTAGYVCVVGFEKQQVHLSFYQKEEN